MKAELITDLGGIEPLEDDWRALAELRGNGFVTPEWFRAWWAHRPEAISPLIAAVRRPDGDLAGVVPLVFDAQRRPKAIRFAGATWGDRFGPAARSEDEDAVAAAAVAAIGERGLSRYMLDLDHVDAGASWWRRLHPGGRSARIEQPQVETPWIDLQGLDWDSYIASRSRNFRQQLRQRERRIRERHEVAIRTATADTLELDLAHFFSLHERRWQSRGISSLKTPGVVGFLQDFSAAAMDRGWLRLRLLEVDGAPAAAFLGWHIGGAYAFYQSGFDPALASLSVGTLLMADTVREAITEGAIEFDMLIGDEAYKRRFTNSEREVQTVVLVGAMRPTRLLAIGEALARRHGRALRDRAGVGRLTGALRRFLPTVDRF